MIVIAILRMVPVNDELDKIRSETDLRVWIRFEQSMKLCEIRFLNRVGLIAGMQNKVSHAKPAIKIKQRDNARGSASNRTIISIRYRRCARLSNYKYWIDRTKWVKNRYTEQTS